MPYLLLDDSFHSHPKVLIAGNAAAGLYTRLLSWSGYNLTDGFIPSAVALSMGTRREINALVSARATPAGSGLLEPTDGGWMIHDYLQHNPSAESVRARRSDLSEKRAAAGRAGGRASGVSRRSKAGSNPEANPEANGQQIEAPPPYPYPPVTSSTTTSKSERAGRAGGGGGPHDDDRLFPVACVAASHLAAMDGVRITNRPAWLAAVARRLASEFHDFIANGLAGTTGDDIVISLGAQVAAASLGIEQPDQGLAASAARRFGMAIASAQAAAGDLDPDSANEEIEATSSDPAWRLAAFTAYTDATSCTPVPRLLAPADEA